MSLVADLIVEVRGRLGDPSETELPTSQISLSIGGATREFSRYHPELREVTVSLVAGVADYALPAGVIGVSEEAMAELGMALQGFILGAEFGRGRPVNPDAYTFWRDLHRDAVLKHARMPPTLEVMDGSPPTLRVLPAPALPGVLALIVEAVREVSSMTRVEVEGIIQWAQGDCLLYIGRKRSKPVDRIPTATGVLQLNDGKDLRDEGTALKDAQECKWGSGASFSVYG